MNRNDFLNMIGNSVPVDRQMIGEVFELIEIFPYFQSAHLLLLKGLYNSADVKFGNQLKQSALHAGDRGVLYWLLNKKNDEVPDQPVKEPEVPAVTEQAIILPAWKGEFSDDLLELDLDEHEEIVSPGIETIVVPNAESEKNIKKQLQSDLIDRFIIANPRIEPQREKIDAPVEDLSRPSTEESEGLVTETLAKIYIRQEYYSRAIEIYEKLSLKFPEKSSYFASQIEKVKEYIKK